MENKDKIILDLCGGTGSWSRPYKEAGYDVRVITLPEYDVRTYMPPENVYGILAAPPCTEFSLAKNGSHRHRNFAEGMETATACLDIICTCRMSGNLKFWALENPVDYLRQFLGRPHYTFYQWWFGDKGIKRTDIWGRFNEPEKKPVEPTEGSKMWRCYGGKSDRTKMLRSITPPGFAQAFFRANP